MLFWGFGQLLLKMLIKLDFNDDAAWFFVMIHDESFINVLLPLFESLTQWLQQRSNIQTILKSENIWNIQALQYDF